jgi:MFS transporter, FHS family, glucose/mannose:H+ symporter
MAASDTKPAFQSARALTFAACASFVPIGIATVLLGPMLPIFSARWSLNYSQAGALFNVQYLASTVAVAFSGYVVSRRGYRFTINAGLVAVALGLGCLLVGSKLLGIACIALYGVGIGLTVPAANLLVAGLNPERRGAMLNLLNFCWSVGAVACPFLIAAAIKGQWLKLMLALVAAFTLAIAIGIAAMRGSAAEPASASEDQKKTRINWSNPAFKALACLFLIYVGTENGFGGWIASYAKELGTMSPDTALITPSFFYISLMLGRSLATVLLRFVDDVRMAQTGLVLACLGMAGLVLSHGLIGVALSGGLAGLGLASVYPITISLVSREFGDLAPSVGSIMFTLAYLGGGILPWLVGVTSTQFSTLKAGLLVPLLGSAAMFAVYLRNWTPPEATVKAAGIASGAG